MIGELKGNPKVPWIGFSLCLKFLRENKQKVSKMRWKLYLFR